MYTFYILFIYIIEAGFLILLSSEYLLIAFPMS